MTKQVVEHEGEPVGIAVPENGKLKFIAVKFHVMGLDNQVYPSLAEMQKAIETLQQPRHA